MLLTVVEIAIRRLLHARVDLLLTFVVPVVFFSIFAMIFGGGLGSTPRVRTLLVDADGTELSAALVERLDESDNLRSTVYDGPLIEADALDAAARRSVQDGLHAAAVVIPAGFADRIQTGQSPPTLPVYADSSNQVAAQVVGALAQQALFKTVQENAAKAVRPVGAAAAEPQSSDDDAPPPVEVVDLLGDGKANPVIASYAAGIAVLFLLFSASGAGGSLLEEQESGTLERLLSSRLSMPQLLLGKWVYILLLGVAQTTVMFAWGQLVFGLDLTGHWQGFAVMTFVTAAAAASFALVLATACRSRSQLSGVSTIIILSMSALGGSMVPRYLMSEQMQTWGLVTFNAWALDGYSKVFWRDQPVAALSDQVTVLTCAALAMLIASRFLAKRWECS